MWLGLLGSAGVWASAVLSVSARHDLGVTGTFARPVPIDGDWALTWGAGGDLVLAPLTQDGGWSADDGQRVALLGRDDLDDHSLVPCPDGGWLHVGSSTVESLDDTSTMHWLDPSLALMSEGVVERAEPARVHNDAAVVCGDGWAGVAYTGPEPADPSWYFALDPAGAGPPQVLDRAPRMSGAGMLALGDELLVVNSQIYLGDLQVNVYDRTLALVEGPIVHPVYGDDEGVWWATGLVQVGAHFLVAAMGRGLDSTWSADTGQVWLLVLDAALGLVEQVPISALAPPEGAMRPWLTLDGDRLLVTADVALQPVLWEVRLDLAALAEAAPADSGAGDGGGVDSGETVRDSDSSPPPPAAEDCGCGVGGGAAGVVWMLVPWWGRRPRTGPPPWPQSRPGQTRRGPAG